MTQETKAIIKSTAPVLKEHGEAITQAMYINLFAAHPEAKELFKMLHLISRKNLQMLYMHMLLILTT